jgi:hypothetical protein
MTAGNVEYEAWKRNYRFRVINTPGFPPFKPESLEQLAREGEFLISDSVLFDMPGPYHDGESTAIAGLEANGATVTKIFERQVTPGSIVVLYRILNPDRGFEPMTSVPADVLNETAEFDNGWKFRGLRHVPGKAKDSVIVTTFWEATPEAKTGFEVIVRAQSPDPDPSKRDGWLDGGDARADLYLAPGDLAAGRNIVGLKSGAIPLKPGGRLLLIVPRLASGAPQSEATLKTSTLRDLGPHTLLLLQRGEDGSISLGRK